MKTNLFYTLTVFVISLSTSLILRADAVPIGCNEDISASLSAPMEVDEYAFSGTAGERIIIRVQGELSITPKITLLGPGGNILTTQTAPTFGLARIGAYSLPTTGTYIIRVSDNSGNFTGTYGISLQFLREDCSNSSISCNEDLTLSLVDLAEMDCFHFTGQMGQRIIVRMEGELSITAHLELYGPSGVDPLAQDTGPTYGLARIGETGAFTLPGDGVYFIVAMDNTGGFTGDYGISLQILDTACSQAINCNADLGLSLINNAEMDGFHFTGQMGQRIILRMEGELSVTARLELYGPTGADPLAQDTGPTYGLARIGETGAFTLPADGVYFILAMDNSGGFKADYGISLQFLDTACSQSINCNADLGPSLVNNAEMDCFHFSGQMGQRIILRMEGEQSITARLELYGPSGVDPLAQDTGPTYGLARIGAFTLPADGDYFIVAMDNSGGFKADYGISLQFLDTACSQVINCNADLGLSLINNAEMDGFHFTGQMGQRIILRMEGELSITARLELYGPTGVDPLAQDTGPTYGLARIGAFTLPADGVYFIVAMDNSGGFTGDYSISFQILDTACSQAITCDGDLTTTIEKLAEMDAYYFDAQQGDRVIIHANSDFSPDLQLEMYGPAGAAPLQNITADPSGYISFGPYPLPTNGPFYLVLMDDNGNNTGDYSISAQILRTSCTQPLACSGDVGTSIANEAEIDGYWFTAEQGQKVLIRSSETTSSFEPEIRIFRKEDPDYVEIFPFNGYLEMTYTSVATDTFFLVFNDQDGSNTGNYGLSIQALAAGCVAPFSCTLDTAATIGFLAEMDAYLLAGQAGQTTLLNVYSSSFTGRLAIYGENGNLLATFETTNNIIQQQWQLPASGNYFAIFTATNGTSTGAYGFSWQLVDPDCADSILDECGETFLASLTRTAEMHAYAIDLPPNQSLLLRGIPASIGLDLRFDLYEATTGAFVQTAGLVSGVVSLPPLTASGQYLLVVSDQGLNETGSYYLSYQYVGAGLTCGPELTCIANTSTALLPLPGAMKTFHFQAESNFRGIIRLIDENNDIVVKGELYGPNGAPVSVTPIANGDSRRFNLGPLAAGDYTLVVMDQGGTHTGNIAVAFENLRDMGCGDNLAYNTNALPSITKRVEMKHYLLDAGPGDAIMCQAKGAGPAFRMVIEIYNALGQLVADTIGAPGAMVRIDKILPTGLHKVVFMEYEGDDTGSFGFSIQKLNPGFNATALPLGAFTTQTFDQPAASDVFVFSGNVGNVVSFEMKEITAAISPRVQLYNPLGQILIQDVGATIAEVVNFTLPMPGVYTVLATDNDGTDTGSYEIGNLVTVTPPAVADFTFTNGEGCQPLTVQFTNASSPNATVFQWSFPGGTPSSSSLQNPVVTYHTPGVYSVSLTASNVAGSVSTTKTDIIVVHPLPTAGFTAMENGLSVSFSNTSTIATSWLWNFGDGSTSTEENPTHVYATGGTYLVTLAATNACGTVLFTQTIDILTPPTAIFHADAVKGCIPFTVQFIDQSEGDPSSWSWTFQGGIPGASTEQHPMVTYNSPGIFPVTLVATNAVGSNTTTLIDYIEVGEPPLPDFSFNPVGNTVFFENDSENSDTYFWDFGDGATSTEIDPLHDYPNAGNYTVTLIAFNEYCSRSVQQTVTIIVGTDDLNWVKIFSLYPNPNDGAFTVHMSGMPSERVDFELFNLAGEMVGARSCSFQTGTLTEAFDFGNFPASVYLLRGRSEGRVVYQKVIIQ
ncbi:MAG: PKD domain-containing protein [Saprospirales bacterium]|nr:PKD domain-containing protein [Saprospirales bacterium]